MDTGSLLAQLSDDIQNVTATRYVSAAGLIMLLYDHMLTFDEEVRHIWRARWTVPKVLFLVLRYVVPLAVIINNYHCLGAGWTYTFTYIVSTKYAPAGCGLATNYSCQVWFGFSIYIGMGALAIENFLVLLRLWNLWERDRRLMTWTLIFFIITQIAVITCASVYLGEITPSVTFEPLLTMCVINNRHNALVMWIPGLVFECLITLAACVNALARPRNSAVATVFYRDGLAFFVILMLLRLLNMILAVTAPLSLLFLGIFFLWCTSTVTVTRLILHLRHAAQQDRHAALPPLDPPPEQEPQEKYEMQIVSTRSSPRKATYG